MTTPLNALTVDVEDWYHVCGVEGPLVGGPSPEQRVGIGLARILDLFSEKGVFATFFGVRAIGPSGKDRLWKSNKKDLFQG